MFIKTLTYISHLAYHLKTNHDYVIKRANKKLCMLKKYSEHFQEPLSMIRGTR